MELFFGNPSGENKIILDENESYHLIKVKRSRAGDVIHITDGEGKLFISEIISVDKHSVTLQILETKTTAEASPQLHVAIAPTKSIDRIEWFLEKATEAGINEITFLQCRHSERKEVNLDRLNKVVIAAMKQSLKVYKPTINPVTSFKSFVSENKSELKLICSAISGNEFTMHNSYQKGKNLLALIGPEGDFHTEELELADRAGFKKVSLGESRLRTETAGLSLCMIFNFINSQ